MVRILGLDNKYESGFRPCAEIETYKWLKKLLHMSNRANYPCNLQPTGNRINSIRIPRSQRLGRHRGTKIEAAHGQEERQSPSNRESPNRRGGSDRPTVLAQCR
ncbi:hypothetical protein TIFTF001_046181 [Ficus carica]|uniref:Uncharacterized protein n=1 Tax=Ficus carica TaxID=3494 RepID=A0AA88CRZ5_FICCA|nr:hypothetical protein TIFTF001_046181 [Ficus carica]